MNIDTDRLQAAHENAQRRFHDMLESGVLRDPDDPFVRRYVQSERAVDRILLELQSEALAAGDHFVYGQPTTRGAAAR
jgi:Holliday junction resolvasome RuvABC endonuclease subunit